MSSMNNVSGPIVAGRVLAFGVIVVGVIMLTIYMKNLQGQSMAVVAPQHMTSMHKDLDPSSFFEKSLPTSSPTMLGSSSGIGSQSMRLGGSTFLPGKNIDPHNDMQYEVRPPTEVKFSTLTPPDVMVPPAQVLPMTNPLPGRRLVNNAHSPGTQISWSTPSPAMPMSAPEAMAPATMAPMAASEAPPVMLGASQARSKGAAGSYFMGAMPSLNQVPQMIVDTRDGEIVQVR